MEIKDMTTADIEVRSAEIEKEIAEGGDVETLSAEVEALEARKAQIEKEAEERKALLDEVAKTSHEVEPLRKENNTMEELRNSKQYIDAYARYIKTGDDRECRTLMTENATGGTLPAPQFVADIVAGEFRRSEIVDGFRKMRAKGNVKVPVEILAKPADVHREGSGEVTEERLIVVNVLLNPITYKKWVGITDEALDVELMDSRSYLEYIFEEISRGILKARENEFLVSVYNTPSTSETPAIVAPTVKAVTRSISDFVNARAKLNADARDLVVIITPTEYAAYKALQMGAQYPIDIFDGMKVIVRDFPIVVESTRAIVGDLRGYMENLPNGEEITFKKDDHTLMTSDIVRILGRLPASVGVVGNAYFVKVISEESEG